MPRVCTICQHTERVEIDKELAAGGSLRGIARKYFGSVQAEDALARHKAEHLPAKLAQAQAAKEVADADTLLAQVRAAHTRLDRILLAAETILARAYTANDHRAALEAIRTAASVHREMRGYFDLLGEIEGELNRQPVVNLTISAEWVEVRAVLLQALQPYPEARAAVAGALLEVEQ